MDELEKYKLINKAETIEELKEAMEAISEKGMIKGRRKSYMANEMIAMVDFIYNDNYPLNFLTRNYGIRQQMLYLLHYNKKRND